MKKIIAVLLFFTMVAVICTSCSYDHDKTTYYTPSQFDTITYDALLEFGGEGSIGHFFRIDMNVDEDHYREADFDKKRGKENEAQCQQAMDDLKDILAGQTLHTLKMPTGKQSYDKYVNDFFSDETNWNRKALLRAQIYALARRAVPQDELYLCQIYISMYYESRCYLFATYMQNDDIFHKKEYIYYTEDQQLMQKLLAWGAKYLDQTNAQQQEYEPAE